MKGLIIDEPWISMILRGEKIWEMRKTANHDRGLIALVRKGSGHVVGVANLAASLPPISAEDYPKTEHLHGIRGAAQVDAIAKGYFVPWVLTDVRILKKPVPYRHKFGAQSRIILDEDVVAAIEEQLNASDGTESATAERKPITSNAASKPERTEHATTSARRSSVVGRIVGDTAYVPITQGNINHNHFYLRSVLSFFPEDAIGGSDAGQRAKKLLTVRYMPGPTTVTDIAGPNRASGEKRSEHYFFRDRRSIKTFYALANAQAGDTVVIHRDGPNSYTITLAKAASK